ncbi:MAG: GAF domain-containing sensor histidine kinase [Pleurocapsa minor GSE-CHR-MK-17-07R]|jgi:signal transduction histidine kinase|nr:GAF domain-containing sensor histidine kinase [Pleurocapsa minor GSE-CHR-MK 17-07R]
MSVSSDAMQKQLARYERIIEISQQLNSTLDLATLLRHIVSAATELTNSEGASILLLDEATGELRFEQASNLSATELERIIVPIEGSIAGWVVSHGEARVIQDVDREPSFFKNVDEELEFRTRNILAVPMKARSRVIGALESVNKNGEERFNSEDIKTLTILAGQAAIAIENAKLFQQSDFMSEMVHELRTPLMALKTSTALLVRPDLPPEKHGYIVSTMQGETERLIRLTSEFLDLARLESGRARLEMSDFEITRLIHECVDIIDSQAVTRGISVQIQSDDHMVMGDRGKLKQVLLNLLTNAVKYNREGGSVLISTYLHRAKANPPMLAVAVSDTGYGISKENQRSMFQKFFRGSDTSGFTAGTGLGLAIAKQIVQGHGGEIWLDSEVGQGSTFYLTLPLVTSS